MLNDTQIVCEFYDRNPQVEYNRIAGRPEYLLTMRFMKRYLNPGDSVLDAGGGPGRYSLALAAMGLNVTLVDLSGQNALFAEREAERQGVKLTAMAGDAREVDKLVSGQFDHVLLMGPLYHILDEAERERAVNACLSKLKPGGTLWASFISMYGGLIYMMKEAPEVMTSPVPLEVIFRKRLIDDENYTGDAFTRAYFAKISDIQPFMARFPLDRLHFFGQEGVMSPCEKSIFAQPADVINAWLDFSEAIAERPEMHSWSEHMMYVGRKRA